jgi:hypothetical protein
MLLLAICWRDAYILARERRESRSGHDAGGTDRCALRLSNVAGFFESAVNPISVSATGTLGGPNGTVNDCDCATVLRHLSDIREAMHAVDAYVQLLMDIEGIAAQQTDPEVATQWRKLARGELPRKSAA